jgi:hypothetical protein
LTLNFYFLCVILLSYIQIYLIVGMNRAKKLKGNWVIRVNGQSVRLKDVSVEVRLGHFLKYFLAFGHLAILVFVIQSRTNFRDSFYLQLVIKR